MTNWQLSAFEELRELGSGGSGRVVLARHLPTGTEVAVKYLAEWLADDADLLGGFRAEARLMAGLVDPHLVTLYEYVETSAGAAIVMDLLEGVSLRRLLAEGGPLTPEAALTLLKGSLLGLAALHRQGIAHRDYKPDNVIVDDAGATTLIDYGIAAPVGEVAEASGTPRYMAPEQWRGESSSAATDVYAATATFVECLTGRPVFDGETAPHLLHQHLHVAPPLDDVPEPVRPLAISGLAKDPAERIGDATSLVAQLESLAPAAYGDQWEQHGREHLATRAALLAFLFAHPRAVGVQPAQAQTDLGTSSISDAGDGGLHSAASDGTAPDDVGESIASVGGSSEVHAITDARTERHNDRLAALHSRRLTMTLGLLLLVAAVLAAMRLTGPSYASTAAFDTGAATRGVVSIAPSTPSPTPSVTPTVAPPAPTPTPSAPPTPTAPEPTPSVVPTRSPAPVVEPTRSPAAPPTSSPAPPKEVGLLPNQPPPPQQQQQGKP